MGRCGCSRGGAGGVMIPGPGLDITGDGTPQRKRIISVVPNAAWCEIATECITTSLCRGLTFDGTCLAIHVSTDPDNKITLEADGLAGECAAVSDCGSSVDRLPAFICGGTYGAGWNNGPSSAMEYERAISMGVPMSQAIAVRSCDGVFHLNPSGASLASTQFTPVSDRQFCELTSSQMRSLLYDMAPEWEWCRAQRGLDTMEEVLDITRGRHILSITVPRQVSHPCEGTVQDLVDAVARQCAYKSVILHLDTTGATVSDRRALSAARAAGIETGITILSAAQAVAHPPADLAAEGIRWVYLDRFLDDATFTAYKAAGLQVMMHRAILRSDVDRAQALGIRGVLSNAWQYTCTTECTGRTTDPWCWPSWPSDQIGTPQILRQVWRGVMGRSLAKAGLGCGWEMPIESVGLQTSVVLLGFMYPLASTTGYTITWDQRWDPGPEGSAQPARTFGLMICGVTDDLPINRDQVTAATTGMGGASLYELLASIGSGPDSVLTINAINKGAASGPAATSPNVVAVPAGSWLTYRAIVTPTQITYQRLDAGGAVVVQAVLAHSGHRGHFIWTTKRQGVGTAASPRFRTSYRNLTITTP